MIVSARKSIPCYFDVDDFTISVWGSAWTGRGTVKVDERVVSSKLSIRFLTTHDFEHRGHRYQVRFIIASTSTALTRIELYRDGAGHAVAGQLIAAVSAARAARPDHAARYHPDTA